MVFMPSEVVNLKVEIKSCVGNKIIASVPQPLDVNLDINIAKRLMGKTAFIGKKKIGRVFDIIGRSKKPYFIIRISPRFRELCSDFLDRQLLIQS